MKKVFRDLEVVVTEDTSPHSGRMAAEVSMIPAPGLSASFDAPETPTPALLARVRCEFLEMPGLRLTIAQAARLWNVDVRTACAMLQALAAARFLTQCHDRSYVRWSG